MRHRNPILGAEDPWDEMSSVSSLSHDSDPDEPAMAKAHAHRLQRASQIVIAGLLVILAIFGMMLHLVSKSRADRRFRRKFARRFGAPMLNSSSIMDYLRISRTNVDSISSRLDPMARTVREAGLLAQASTKRMPSWENVSTLYGNEPVVLGMESCPRYHEQVPIDKRYVAPGGLFNTGTNALDNHLSLNLLGIRTVWQLPWGKHWLPNDARHKRKASDMENEDHDQVLPVIVVRDPLFWLQSMCQTPYSVTWVSHRSHQCRTFPKNADGTRVLSSLIRLRMETGYEPQFDSLIHLWNEFYGQYMDAPYPRLIIRFEDLLWHAPSVLDHITECVGAPAMNGPYWYVTSPAKTHGGVMSNLLDAMGQAGDAKARVRGYLTPMDVQEARRLIDPRLSRAFHYTL